MSLTHRAVATVCNRRGLHARAAAKFVKTAEQFQAELRVSKRATTDSIGETSEVSGRSILGLMMLGAEQGSELCLEAQGDDAEKALAAILALIATRFGEEA